MSAASAVAVSDLAAQTKRIRGRRLGTSRPAVSDTRKPQTVSARFTRAPKPRAPKRVRKFDIEEEKLLGRFKKWLVAQATGGNINIKIASITDAEMKIWLRDPSLVSTWYPEFAQARTNKLWKRLVKFSTSWYSECLESFNLHENKGDAESASGQYDIEGIASHCYTSEHEDGLPTSIELRQTGSRKVAAANHRATEILDENGEGTGEFDYARGTWSEDSRFDENSEEFANQYAENFERIEE
jgi:hypothetical protein